MNYDDYSTPIMMAKIENYLIVLNLGDEQFIADLEDDPSDVGVRLYDYFQTLTPDQQLAALTDLARHIKQQVIKPGVPYLATAGK